jgi:hypothetical protein
VAPLCHRAWTSAVLHVTYDKPEWLVGCTLRRGHTAHNSLPNNMPEAGIEPAPRFRGKGF